MPTIDLTPIQGLPFSAARPYLEQCLGLSDRLDGTSDAYALGYLSRATRMDLGKICSRGTACGSTCIPRKKQCSPDKQASTSTLAKEASAKARGKLINSLKEERDKKRSERIAKREAESRKPPQGALGSFPSPTTLGEIRDRFKPASGLSGNAGELPHEKGTREKFEKLSKQRSLQQAIAEAETRLATGVDEDGDPIDEAMRRATERQLKRQKEMLKKMGGTPKPTGAAIPSTDPTSFSLQGRSRPTQFTSRTGRTVSIDSLYSDRSDSFLRGYYKRMAERGDANPFPTQKVITYGDRRILIQTPKGQHRFFGAVPQQADYGVIAGTYGMGGDGRSLDCYVGDNLGSGKCYEVQQLTRSGEPDEVKLMLGFNSPEEASETYKAHVPVSRFGSIREIDFDSYIRGDTTQSQQRKIGKVMHEFKSGKLKSGSGAKVKSRKQAVAIALSEAGMGRR